MHPFERVLSVLTTEIEFEIRGVKEFAWADFWLNPRKLRGSDFLMRWSQGVWSEHRLTDSVNRTNQFYAIPYGPSGTAPDNDVRAFELYFERLEKAGLGNIKRPDLLIFKIAEKNFVDKFLTKIGGVEELPFITEDKLEDLKNYYHYAYQLGISTERPNLVPAFIEDKNGHILPYVKFEGGSLEITTDAITLLRQL